MQKQKTFLTDPIKTNGCSIKSIVILKARKGLKDPVNLGRGLWAVRVRGRELCKVAPEQVRGDNAISTVSGSFAATAAQDDAGENRARWPRHRGRGDMQ